MTDEPRFAHASEAELARILDYYGIRWEYEPHTFPIQWNLDGTVVESFAPDFFLPDLGLHVELTTLKQSLVRRKNRKLRRVRELYPDVRVKLFYGKDFKALMLKYGRLDLATSLSGLEGQVLADRRADLVSARVAPQPAPPPSIAAESHWTATETGPAETRPHAETDVRSRRRLSRGSRRRRARRQYSAAA